MGSKLTRRYRLPMPRMPDGVLGRFLRAQGAGVDPVYAALVVGDLPAHAATHEPTGVDEVHDIDILNTGVLLSAHQARHRPAGLDPLPVGVPSDVGVANAAGVAEAFARQDHVHNHPAALHKYGGGRDLTDYFLGFEHLKQKFYMRDDFWGDLLDDRWNGTGSAGGSTALQDGVDGGVLRFTTHTDFNDQWLINWGDFRILRAAKNVVAEARIKALQTTYLTVTFALVFDADNQIRFHVSDDAGVVPWWRVWCHSGGVSTNLATGVQLDLGWHILRMVCTTAAVTFYIDGVLVQTIDTNIPASYLQVAITVATKTTAARNADLDYVEVQQDR